MNFLKLVVVIWLCISFVSSQSSSVALSTSNASASSSTSASSQSTSIQQSTTTITSQTTTLSAQLCTKNSSLCNYNGDCTNDTSCQCYAGFSGTKCEYRACKESDNQCLNNGTCFEHVLTNEKRCQCLPQYVGALCEKPVCINYCYNNGICGFNSTSVPTCTCLDRFYGLQCEFDYCLSQKNSCNPRDKCYLSRENSVCQCSCNERCDASFCTSNGNCQYANDELSCKCKVGFSGPRCQTNDCKGYCFNNGTCLTNGQIAIKCNCTADFEGERCENSKIIIVPVAQRSSIVVYLILVSFLLCAIAIGIYTYKNGGIVFVREQFENMTYRLRSLVNRPSQNTGSRIPYVQTRNKPSDEAYLDPFN